MNLNWINKIFGARPPLSRKDIADYGNNPDAELRHEIEMKEASGSFEADAMEGWESMDYDVSRMERLDKRFMNSSKSGWLIGGGALVVAAIVTSALFINSNNNTDNITNDNPSKEKITVLLDEQEVKLEQSDIILPDSINALIDAPVEKRIEPKIIQEEFKQMKNAYQEQPLPQIEMIPLDQIRINTKTVKPEIIKEHKKAKEIYLYDLKLVDYRKYRSKPAVKTKQVVLTGTPANMEGEETEETVSELQEVEIPYVEYLNKTMRKFSRGSFKSALSRFDIILATYRDDVNANFYSGLCLYNLGEYEAAIDRFLACRTSGFSNFDEEAQWMTALSYEKSGKEVEARQYFEKIVAQGGFYKKRAQAKMK